MSNNGEQLSACAQLAQSLIAQRCSPAVGLQAGDQGTQKGASCAKPPPVCTPLDAHRPDHVTTGHAGLAVPSSAADQSSNSRQPQSSTVPDAIPATKAPTDTAQMSAKQLCNIVLQSTFPYVEAIMGLLVIEVFQEQVDKAMIFDYARAVEPTVECWLGLIRSKLLAHEYEYPDQMVRDVDKIRKCAEQYHGKRQSKFRNPVVPANAKALQTTFTFACHNIRPALDAIMKGRGAVAALQQLDVLMKDWPSADTEDFRTQLPDERGAVYYPKMRHAQRILAKKLLQDPQKHAIKAPPPLASLPHIPPQPAAATPSIPKRDSTESLQSPSPAFPGKGQKRGREDLTDAIFDEPSFQHLCKIMRTTYSTSDMDLASIRAELVECENRTADKHAFFLQLRDGKRHRSVRQLELEWCQRKVTRQDPASLATAAGQSSNGLQGAAALGTQADKGSVAAQSFLPQLPQLPLVPQTSPGQPHSQAQSLSGIKLRSQPRSAGQTKSESVMQSQPQTLRQTSPHSQQSLHQLKNNVRQDERKQQQPKAAAHESPLFQQQNGTGNVQGSSANGNLASATASDPNVAPRASVTEAKLLGRGNSRSCEASPSLSMDPCLQSSHSHLEGICDQVRTADKTSNEPLASQQQDARCEEASLDEGLVQQIEVHHNALKSIYTQQMQEKRSSLGLHQLRDKSTSLESQVKGKESQVDRYSKILDLLRQSTHLDDTDQQYLAETLERVETARQALTSMQQQQHVLQTLLDQGNSQFRCFQNNLLSRLRILDFDRLST